MAQEECAAPEAEGLVVDLGVVDLAAVVADREVAAAQAVASAGSSANELARHSTALFTV